MSRKKATLDPRRSSPSLLGLSSGFGFGRVFTTRARAFYERRYKVRHAHPMSRFVFVFDMLLVSVVGVLLGIILIVSLRSFAPDSFQVTFESTEASSIGRIPIVATVRVAEGTGSHRNVRAYWKIPSGVEVVETIPASASDGSVFLGEFAEGDEIQLYAVVHAYRPVGDTVIVGLQLQEGVLLDSRSMVASFDARIVSQGFSAEIPKEILAEHVVSRDAVIPIRLQNQTDQIIPSVEIRPTDRSTIDFSRQMLGDLSPGEERFVSIPLGRLSESPVLGWSVHVKSREITSSTWSADVVEWPEAPTIDGVFAFNQKGVSDVRVEGDEDSEMILIGSTANPSIQIFSLKGSNDRLLLQLDPLRKTESVLLASIKTLDDGSRILGPARFGSATEELPLTSVIRYHSASGDQIGAGANPPNINEETRYWVFFSVDVTQVPVERIHVRATLPAGVSFTGLVADPDGGAWSATNRTLDWKLPSVADGRSSVMIGAELSLTPTEGMVAPYELVSGVIAEAVEVNTGVRLEIEQGGLTTEDVDK